MSKPKIIPPSVARSASPNAAHLVCDVRCSKTKNLHTYHVGPCAAFDWGLCARDSYQLQGRRRGSIGTYGGHGHSTLFSGCGHAAASTATTACSKFGRWEMTQDRQEDHGRGVRKRRRLRWRRTRGLWRRRRRRRSGGWERRSQRRPQYQLVKEGTVFNSRNSPSDNSDIEDSPSKLEGFHVLLTNGWSVSERNPYTSHHGCRYPSSALNQTDENFNLK